jgi:hypothetical protein
LHAGEHGRRHGRIDGRRAVVQADDFTIRGGAADAAIWQKMVWPERAAHDLRIRLLCDWAQRAHELVAMELAAGPKARGPRP